MEDILTSLQELDQLYHADSLAEYEKMLQIVAAQAEQIFPGFTIAYAEIYTAGRARQADGRMAHVLLPVKERNELHETVQNH